MGTDEYKQIASKRAGIEGVPSVLRRRYGIDELPVRGLPRIKVWFGLDIASINCKRLIRGIIHKVKEKSKKLSTEQDTGRRLSFS